MFKMVILSVPNWFFGYDVILEFLFAIITLVVSIFAFKIYKLSNQRQSKLFGIAFLFISLSYFVQSLVNFAIISKLNQNICTALKITSVNTLNIMGIYAYILLFIVGLVILTYMTLKIKSPKILSLLIVLVVITLILNQNALYLFYLFSSLFLAYIVIHYFRNYLKRKQGKTLLVLTAFVFLFFGSAHFIFSINHGLYYIIGHVLELVAYLLILINLYLVIKK